MSSEAASTGAAVRAMRAARMVVIKRVMSVSFGDDANQSGDDAPLPARVDVERRPRRGIAPRRRGQVTQGAGRDRKSTRLNSSHVKISYAVFCLKKKKEKNYVS